MAGSYANQNLMRARASAYFSYAGSSEVITLPIGTKAVTLRATTACIVKIGKAGESATAAAASGEKVWVDDSVFMEANDTQDFTIDPHSEQYPVQIAVIQETSAGVLKVTARD